MVQKSRTHDEKFILMCYQKASAAGDMEMPFNRYEVGTACGMAVKATDTICKALLQTNFIKKVNDVDVRLTKNGEQLALRLLSE